MSSAAAVAAPAIARSRPQPGRIRAGWWRHPELPALVAATAAWIALGVHHYATHNSDATGWGFRWWGWALMVVAMMVPGIVPMLRHVAFNSLWRRRHRSAGLFAGMYVAVWTAVGIGAWVAVSLVSRASGVSFDPGTGTVLVVAAVAVAWQFSPTKHRAIRRCHLRRPLAPSGWPADRSVLSYGGFHARACVESCWAIMAVMFVAGHDFHLMVPLAAVTLVERYQTRPYAWPGAAALVVTALLAL